MLSDLITTVSDYTTWTETVAVYPRSDSKRAREYEIFGFLSEIGEICGMLKRELRDPDYTLERLSLKLELGDVAWYLARIHYEHEHEPDSEEENTVKKLLDYLKIEPQSHGCFEVSISIYNHFRDIAKSRTKTVNYLIGTDLSKINSLSDLRELLEYVKNNNSEEEMMAGATVIAMAQMYDISIARLMLNIIDNMNGTLGIIGFYILCDRFRFDPLDVMKTNFTKLEDRKERGKLHGKGDYR